MGHPPSLIAADASCSRIALDAMELEAPATVVGASCSGIALDAMELEAPATVV